MRCCTCFSRSVCSIGVSRCCLAAFRRCQCASQTLKLSYGEALGATCHMEPYASSPQLRHRAGTSDVSSGVWAGGCGCGNYNFLEAAQTSHCKGITCTANRGMLSVIARLNIVFCCRLDCERVSKPGCCHAMSSVAGRVITRVKGLLRRAWAGGGTGTSM